MRHSPRSRTGSLWLQLLLVGALAAVAILVVQTLRTAQNSRALAGRALRDYSAFAAWSYREHLVGELRSALDEVLGPVNHGGEMHMGRRVPSASELGHYLRWNRACLCHEARRGPNPLRFYGFTLGSDTLGVGGNYETGPRGWLADAPPGRPVRTAASFGISASDAASLNRVLTNIARTTTPTQSGYRLYIAQRGDSTRVIAIRNMPTDFGDTLVYGVEYSRSSADSLFRNVLERSDLLPRSLVGGRLNQQVIDVEVSDRNGAPVYRSRPTEEWRLAAMNALPDEFGGLTVKAQIRPELAESLLIGGVPASRIPVLLVMLVLALGLTLVAAVQLRRDVRFASERDRFVANVSHELRTPLAQVRLVLDTIRLGRDTDATVRQSALELADREVLRLQHLVDGLLRFSRGPRQGDPPRMLTDVAADARLAAKEFAPLAAPRGISIEVSGVSSAVASMHRDALHQVLLNLLDNAVKYGRDGVPIRVEVTTPPGAGPCLAVTDSGPGVPDAEKLRIWKPFERGAQARARAAGGSGIGLTIVRDIAAEHGGRAWVEDAPGGGARFVFQLPAAGA